MNKFFSHPFRFSLLLILFTEILSLCGFLLDDFGRLAFLILAAAIYLATLIRLEYGILILLVELFIGSKGYLFYFDYNGIDISIRMVIWLAVMSVWASNVITLSINSRQRPRLALLRSAFLPFYFMLALTISFGIASAFLVRTPLTDIFFDLNNWLYLAMLFPLYHVIKNKEFTDRLFPVLTAAITWVAAKTFFLLFIFSHNLIGMVGEIYRWVRDTGVGEITLIQGGFYRIFFQSHIFFLPFFFIFLLLTTYLWQTKRHQEFWLSTLILGVITAVNLITFSRSNWIGLLAGSLLLAAWLIYQNKKAKALTVMALGFFSILMGLIFIIAIVKFPYPNPLGGFNTGELFSDRASQISGEAGVSSRWSLLPPLWQAIMKEPVFGSGFGRSVTYLSEDPRILESNPTGEYTTYSFEWGWLDIWLKLGIFGLLSYLALIAIIIFKCSRINDNYITLALGFGLISMSAVSFFSPYMNHPLGLGFLALVAVLVENPPE